MKPDRKIMFLSLGNAYFINRQIKASMYTNRSTALCTKHTSIIHSDNLILTLRREKSRSFVHTKFKWRGLKLPLPIYMLYATSVAFVFENSTGL